MKPRGSSAARRLRDLATALEREGPAVTFRRVRDHYLRRDEFVLHRWDRGDPLLEVGLEPGYRWLRGDRGLLDRERARGADLPRELFVDRTHGGEHFYAVYKDDEPAHIHWIFGRGGYSRFFDLAEGSAEINYIYTFPEHRGRGLLKRAIACTLADLAEHGYARVCTAVTAGNVDCIRGLRGSGLREFARSRSFLSLVSKVSV